MVQGYERNKVIRTGFIRHSLQIKYHTLCVYKSTLIFSGLQYAEKFVLISIQKLLNKS